MEKDIIDELWDAWKDQEHVIKELSFEHFILTLEIQIKEICQHYSNSNKEKTLNEIADLLSVSVNLFRWFGLLPQDIKEVIHNRIENRYIDKTRDIIIKYLNMKEEHESLG